MDGFLPPGEEQRLRELANGIIRGIQTPEEVLDILGFTSQEYTDLTETRMFRQMLRQAQDEWEGASNTHKRIKLSRREHRAGFTALLHGDDRPQGAA